jgi:hypothetical protein
MKAEHFSRSLGVNCGFSIVDSQDLYLNSPKMARSRKSSPSSPGALCLPAEAAARDTLSLRRIPHWCIILSAQLDASSP